MIFTELRFFGFFAIAFVVYWLMPWARGRKTWLLVCSYVFYGAWDWRFLSLIWLSTIVDYVVGRLLEPAAPAKRRKALITTSLLVNLGLLAAFKYFDFFVGSAVELATALGVQLSQPTLQIVLPVGISFYTFQTLSYSIDVYRRRIETEHDLLDFALFVAFFPQLVAGPIVRASDFLPQLKTKKFLGSIHFRNALGLFLVGFFKKACVSDNISPFVDAYFQAPETYDALSAWIATLSYSAQIYCDFSGYSDMAIATAALFGFNLCVNFDAPYLSSNIREFWNRWHISLSTWLRDYLYIPLGGSRSGKWLTYRNLMLTMLLGGLWHGAAWRFILWGGMHGGALAMHRLADPWLRGAHGWVTRALGAAATYYWVCAAWILFRAEDMPRARSALRAFMLFDSAGTAALPTSLLGAIAALGVVHLLFRWERPTQLFERSPSWALAVTYGVVAAVLVAFLSKEVQPFIYFQF